jgi:hypothetical protein
LLLIDNLCQAYHWTIGEAFRLTLPQIIMLNHAAKVNHDRMMERMDQDKAVKDKKDEEQRKKDKLDPVIPTLGKRMSECNSEEIASQFAPGAW